MASLNQQVTSLNQQVTSLNQQVTVQQAKLNQVVPMAETLNTTIVTTLTTETMPVVEQAQSAVTQVVTAGSCDSGTAALIDAVMNQLINDLLNQFQGVQDTLDAYIDSLEALVGARAGSLGIEAATPPMAAAVTDAAAAATVGPNNHKKGDTGERDSGDGMQQARPGSSR